MSTTLATTPTGSSLQRLAEQSWERLGGDARLVFEGVTWSGDRLAERTRRLAQGLRDAGLRPGERVIVCMANCVEVGIAYAAVWRAGAVTTPVLFLLSEQELRHVLADSEAAYVVTTPEFLPKVTTAAQGIATLRGVVLAGGEAAGTIPLADLESAPEGEPVDRDPAELAALLYTGGTTGRSKGVMLSHDAMSTAAWAAVSVSFDPRHTVALIPLPLSHAYGLLVSTMALHTPEPGTSHLMRWFDPTGWLELAANASVSVGAVVPSMVQMLLAQRVEDYDLSALWRVTSGAAPLLAETREEFTRRLPHVELAEGYGCTESAGIIASSPLHGVKPGSVGPPVPGVQLRLERPDGTDAGRGEDGEICVRGTNLMTGYWNSPDETAYALRGVGLRAERDVWLHTGDVGRVDEDGYLYVVDRLKDLIIRGGINVYPRDVEDVMLTHPDVVGAAVVGRPDPKYGEEIVAFVQLRPGAEVAEGDLVAHARRRLSRAKYPREVRVIDAIPLTSVLKTDRKAIRTLL